MEDQYIITLQCKNCENSECDICPLGKIVHGNQGCTRILSEDDFSRYEHYTEEVIPFMSINKTNRYKEVIDFFYYIYSLPLGKKLGPDGKAVSI